jgi:diguanylate cyclase (GGDEF)-like protein
VEDHQRPENRDQPTATDLKRGLTSTLQQPFASLPSRIVMSVVLATLGTALIVTWISTRSIGTFLGREIDQRFDGVLQEAQGRLGKWYAQRELDVETFAHSRVALESFSHLGSDVDGRAGTRAREEVRSYLGYVLERFPQFETLFVLDLEGHVLVWVGRERELPPALRSALAAIEEPAVSGVQHAGDQLIQVASAPVDDAGTRLSLHALLRIGAIAAQLDSDALGASGAVYVVARDGSVLLGTPGADLLERHELPLPPSGRSRAAADYIRPDGEHVVGSAAPFGHFGWTLVVEESYDEAFAPVVSVIRKILGINLAIVAVFSALAFWLARSIVRPILALSDGALRIATGETDVVIPGRRRNDEIGVLTRAFHEMMIRLKRNREELKEKTLEIEDANQRLITQNEELQRVNDVFEQLSITDDLTKLHNHRFFQDHLPREMSRAERTGEPLSLILIDIDDFKMLNDRYGHSVGDAVLRRVADVMSTEVREMDLLARYGGEEFVLLASKTTLEGAAALAEKLCLAVSRAHFSLVALDGPAKIRVTVSGGVSTYRGDEKAFFNEADRALYRAKEAGKDCVVVAGGDQLLRSSER